MLQYLLRDLTSRCGFLCPPGKVWAWSGAGGGCPWGERTPDPLKSSPPGRALGLPCRGGPAGGSGSLSPLARALPFVWTPIPRFCPLTSFTRVCPRPSIISQIFIEHRLDYLPGCAGDTGSIAFLVGLHPIGGRGTLIEKPISPITSGTDNCYKKIK